LKAFYKGESLMGLMDEVLSMAGCAGGAQQDQHATALSAILSYINSPQVGGIAGLQQMFQQGGLGHVVSSWIGSGQNLPVSASQLQNVLHGGALQQAAQQSGMDPSQLTGLMATLLPHLVNHLTPNGQVPDASSLQKMLSGLSASA
jgi:uncharacterized protein YidB (DUF937 family)